GVGGRITLVECSRRGQHSFTRRALAVIGGSSSAAACSAEGSGAAVGALVRSRLTAAVGAAQQVVAAPVTLRTRVRLARPVEDHFGQRPAWLVEINASDLLDPSFEPDVEAVVRLGKGGKHALDMLALEMHEHTRT